MIQAQQARDQKILKLVMAMEETFSFIISANELKTRERLQDIINQILRQTIKCGYFIQDYTRHHFGGKGRRHLQRDNEMTKYLPERTIVQPFSGIDDQITAFCTAFTDLRTTFDSKLALNTALVLSRAVATIDATSASLYFYATTQTSLQFLYRTSSVVVTSQTCGDERVQPEELPSHHSVRHHQIHYRVDY